MQRMAIRVSSPSAQGYAILHVAFAAVPIIAGLDKFFHVLTNWEKYLSPLVPQATGVDPHLFMLVAGAIEIVAGLLVIARPRVGALIVGFWLCGIVLNLLTMPGYLDIALRDFGLALGAFALARLSVDPFEMMP